MCNHPVKQADSKNGPACAEASAGRESENFAFVSGAKGEFQVKYSALDMKQAFWRRTENAAGDV
ncbi:MAG: hypothetical protein B5M56_01250 [Desulfococcus sp. 4484_241]|nr:MAG: hypothetical protein B5M56_01250 [Desulfococcus sp. 4484_241]